MCFNRTGRKTPTLPFEYTLSVTFLLITSRLYIELSMQLNQKKALKIKYLILTSNYELDVFLLKYNVSLVNYLTCFSFHMVVFSHNFIELFVHKYGMHTSIKNEMLTIKYMVSNNKTFQNISNFSEKFEYSLNVQTHNLTFIL